MKTAMEIVLSVSHISHLSQFSPNITIKLISLSCKEWIVKRRSSLFSLYGTVPGSRKFSVDKVWRAAATVGQGGNFFVPAARVISSSLNYASAEVSDGVRARQVQRERGDRGEPSHKAHKTLKYQQVNPAILDGREKGHQWRSRAIGTT